jgi:hypothetical protein
MLLFVATVASGCGADCSGQSIPHCPGPGGAECVDGLWHCFLFDLPAQRPADFSAVHDFSSAD